MVEFRNTNPYGPLSEERLQDFEKSLGAPLPTDYREFLKEHNGGEPTPSYFWIVEGSDGSGVNHFYGLHNGPEWFSIDSYVGADRHGIPEGMLAIGDDGVGNIICLSYKEVGRGAIYFVDHEVHPYDEPNSLEGITKLANSFPEFLSHLQQM